MKVKKKRFVEGRQEGKIPEGRGAPSLCVVWGVTSPLGLESAKGQAGKNRRPKKVLTIKNR